MDPKPLNPRTRNSDSSNPESLKPSSKPKVCDVDALHRGILAQHKDSGGSDGGGSST